MLKKKTCPKCFSSIGEGTRVKIIQCLKSGPNNAGDIESHFTLTQPTISYHLKTLERLGIVFSKKKGREIYYYLNKKYPCKKCLILKMPCLAG
ncbi:MAG: metalloregulator ArsR/SmtB family transcription factor, partial [bacterium]|nr:metalloregulator ArsR/SmtB family transcription factor [bacterium]